MRMRELMGKVMLDTVLQFPTVRLPASELTTLMPGTVLRLPLAKHSASELRVGGLRFGQAYPVRVGEHRGAQLEFSSEDGSRSDVLGDQGMAESKSVN